MKSQTVGLFIQSAFEFLSEISNGAWKFVFAMLMNFLLMFFIFCLNLTSAVIADLLTSL